MKQSRNRQSMRGYSLIEALVVLAIVGLISVASVPAFMNFMHTNKIKSSLRQFTTDLRSARQRAVTRDRLARLTFDTAARPGTYQVFDGTVAGTTTTWTAVTKVKAMEQDVFFFTDGTHPTISDTVDASGASGTDGKPDLVFLQNGTSNTGDIYLRTTHDKIAFDEYKISLTAAGSVTVVAERY